MLNNNQHHSEKTYIPAPIDVSEITLSNDILSLTEILAKNVHEVWAEHRMREGWKYGEIRDFGLKITPCLVPYDELPEVEKEYDRNTAVETLKLLVKLGYIISKEENNDL